MRLRVAALVVFAGVAALLAATQSTVTIRLDPHNGGAPPAKTLVFTNEGRASSPPTRAAGQQYTADSGSEWQVHVDADGWWSPTRTIVFPASGVAEETLPVWRTGIVSGKVTAGDPDIEVPKAITLTVESPPEPATPPEIARGTQFECPVGADGGWSCRVPATTLDLVIRQKGITPHYRWGVAVAANESKDLGTFVLKHGASLSAWLDRATLKQLKTSAHARLVRSVTPYGGQTSARLSAPVAEATFNSRGAVQLAPVPPGTYVLEVSADGFATSRVAPVEIFRGSESVFRKPIELHPPLTVSVTVEPPADADGKPWHIDWRRNNDFVTGAEPLPGFKDAVGNDGVVKIPQQEPGTFVATILSANGDRVADRSFVIHDELDADLRIKLESHTVHGKLRLGGEPLAATIWFGGKFGAQRIKATSDAEGVFKAGVPHRGEWMLDIESSEPALLTIAKVSIGENDDALDINLPDTRVSGWVVGSDAQRVTRGDVNVIAGNRALNVPLAPDGSFQLRALPPGKLTISARDRRSGESSSHVELTLAEGAHHENVELRIEPSHAVTGTVMSRGQAVIGASISGLALDLGTQPWASTATDVNGRFVLYLNAQAKRARITVAAPGRTLQVFELAITPTPLTIELEPVGGTLELGVSGPFRLSRNGVPIPVNVITDWMSGHGDPLEDLAVMRIPDVAPGRYDVCSAKSAACVSGELAPGGTLQLIVPK